MSLRGIGGDQRLFLSALPSRKETPLTIWMGLRAGVDFSVLLCYRRLRAISLTSDLFMAEDHTR